MIVCTLGVLTLWKIFSCLSVVKDFQLFSERTENSYRLPD